MLDPRIWDSQQVMGLTDSQFKLYIYLISQADDEGRVKVSLPLFRARVHPCDNFSEKMVDVDLEQIARAGLVVAYKDENYAYLWHPNWFRYQRIDRPSPSLLPAVDDSSVEVLYELSSMTRRLIAERSTNAKKLTKSISVDSTNDRRALDEPSVSPRDTLIYTNLSSPKLKEREDSSEDRGEGSGNLGGAPHPSSKRHRAEVERYYEECPECWALGWATKMERVGPGRFECPAHGERDRERSE